MVEMLLCCVSRSIRQPEHDLGDDVELDFAGPALDGIAARSQPIARLLELVARKTGRFPAEAARSEHRHQELLPALVELRAVDFENRALRARGADGFGAVDRELKRELEAGLIHEQLSQPVAEQ